MSFHLTDVCYLLFMFGKQLEALLCKAYCKPGTGLTTDPICGSTRRVGEGKERGCGSSCGMSRKWGRDWTTANAGNLGLTTSSARPIPGVRAGQRIQPFKTLNCPRSPSLPRGVLQLTSIAPSHSPPPCGCLTKGHDLPGYLSLFSSPASGFHFGKDKAGTRIVGSQRYASKRGRHG